jgi:hypothetical protein
MLCPSRGWHQGGVGGWPGLRFPIRSLAGRRFSMRVQYALGVAVRESLLAEADEVIE